MMDEESSLYSAVFSHLLGGGIGVSASTIPIARDRLGIERDHDTELFGHTVQYVARHPQVIACADAFARTHLKLPLGRHHFAVDATYLDAGVQTRLVVSVNHVTSIRTIRAHRAVIWSLSLRKAMRLRPAEWPTVAVQ